MDEDIIKMANNKKLATFRVQQWVGNYTKTEIAELLGIARATLYDRIEKHNWNIKEIKLINKHLPF